MFEELLCMAYANVLKRGGNGCMLWTGDLVDIQEAPSFTSEIYVRLAFSDLGSRKKKRKMIPLIIALVVGMSIMLGVMFVLWRKWKKNPVPKGEDEQVGNDTDQLYTEESHKDDLELPLFNLSEIAKATHNFSFNNKLGEGGYGPVYKGVLQDGKEVAVKRLSKNVQSRTDEFKNEVICISKLQHRNLVRLLGCCIQGNEKMLIYEYMPIKVLITSYSMKAGENYLIGPHASTLSTDCPWLQYLHEDSDSGLSIEILKRAIF
ncbi:hypothetical protein OSB04_004008 [Centaurea solstitialis]|uniref:non-specific serine/threonine protein kinase n=1 Tax=Centaurea solstitialis TaxID=347529 RepID=A0AA38WPE4_9ASTR|nr:hypothetical protein OSB04_004008 [Centaurea solstitialis]